MATKKFTVDILSKSSVEDLKRKIEAYRDDLPRKCEEIATELAKIGLDVASAKVNESPLGKYVTLSIQNENIPNGSKALLIARGEVKQSEGYADFSTILAIEFGAGIYYNKTINPNADKLGYGPGTFPGQIHAMEDGWYFWDEKNQVWKYTHGVRATMPMYNATMEIYNQAVKVVKGVFA